MNDTYLWTETYDHAVQAFGQTPLAEAEATVLEHFERAPDRVLTEIDRVAKDLHDGKVTWGWSALAAALKRGPSREAVVTGTHERKQRILATQRWLQNTGLMFDRESELLDEVFGDAGRLRQYADDPELRRQILEQYHELRPKGEASEQASLDYQERIRTQREQLAAKLKAHRQSLKDVEVPF